MKRIFIAVKVEAGINLLNMISSLKSGLENEKISWTNPDNIHITLAFLGDTKEKQIKSIGAILKEKCEGSGSFELILKGSGVFKSLNDPRIIWTGIELSEKIIQLNQLVKTGLTESGIVIEDRPFKPHLTLGRVKHIGDTGVLKRLLESYNDTEIQKVPVNEVILYESILLYTGPLYKPIVKIAL
ncbi:MAG: RNA 2',3'-cyclic phosphodiesterase [Bacteroidales bacterium]|nr:RNA 2',3'-cyclic phosphodiesterase [Bacteroidales bacterium]